LQVDDRKRTRDGKAKEECPEEDSMKATSKRTRKAAKKLFPKVPRNTRPFSKADYDALPKG
jgi:hypothetical protein